MRPGRRRIAARLAAGLALAAAVTAVVACGPQGPPVSTDPPGEVLLIGIDGATWDVIEPLARDGELPILASLMEGGTWGRLRSLRPSLSSRIWTSIATGVSPEEHGVLHFVHEEEGRRRLYTSDQIRVPVLWEVASAHGVPAGVVNYWFSYPAQPVRGYVVSDHTIPARSERIIRSFSKGESPPPDPAKLVHPASLWEHIAPLIDRPRIEAPGAEPASLEWRFFKLYDVFMEDTLVADVALTADAVHPTRLRVVYWKGVDRISHLFWQFHRPGDPVYAESPPSDRLRALYGDFVPWIYRHTDALVGRLVRELGPGDVVAIVSDHGFEAIPPQRTFSGGHGRTDASVDGIYLLAGGPVAARGRGPDLSLYDVVPTLLHLLGVPTPPYVEGEVATALLRPEWRERHAVETAEAPVEPERVRAGDGVAAPLEEDALERLRALGYLE